MSVISAYELAGEVDVHIGDCGMFLEMGENTLRTKRADHAVDRGFYCHHPVRRGLQEGGGESEEADNG